MAKVLALLQKPVNQRNQGRGGQRGFRGQFQEFGPHEVLTTKKVNELRMSSEMFVSEIEQLHHPFQWGDMLHFELEFLLSQLAQHMFEDRHIERVLAAEVIGGSWDFARDLRQIIDTRAPL